MIEKINIKETKLDDIKAARDAWDADFNKRTSDYESQGDKYTNALYDVMDNVKEEILNKLNIPNELLDNLQVDVKPYAGNYGSKYKTGVKFNYADYSRDENVALRWNIDIDLNDDGSVRKQSGSWSGLDVVTPDKLLNLKMSVELIENIMNLDWQDILMDAENRRPNRDDYYTMKRPDRSTRPDFEQQMIEASIEDIIGTDTLVACTAPPSAGYKLGTMGYAKIIRDTGKQYKVSFIPNWFVTRGETTPDKFTECGVKKEFFIKNVVKDNNGNLKYLDI